MKSLGLLGGSIDACEQRAKAQVTTRVALKTDRNWCKVGSGMMEHVCPNQHGSECHGKVYLRYSHENVIRRPAVDPEAPCRLAA